MEALLSIVRAEGVKGTLVGGKEQLMREIPFNAIQFTVYEVRLVLSASVPRPPSPPCPPLREFVSFLC